MSRSVSNLESPRTACPKDGDAFSYNPAHLRAWYLPDDIWARLPAQLRTNLAAVQHSGAAVLTGTFCTRFTWLPRVIGPITCNSKLTLSRL
jgi:hypothetical protein